MSDFKIEKGIQLIARCRGSGCKYPFDNMEVGDSFFIDGKNELSKVVYSSASNYGRRHNMKFKTRSVDGGIRIWRVK